MESNPLTPEKLDQALFAAFKVAKVKALAIRDYINSLDHQRLQNVGQFVDDFAEVALDHFFLKEDQDIIPAEYTSIVCSFNSAYTKLLQEFCQLYSS
jgi:hypothetical protein